MSITKYADLIYRNRPVSSRSPMDRGRRAKQFAPFDALKGFEETVRKEEVRYEVRRSMAEDQREELNRSLQELEEGTAVEAVYFEESILFPRRGQYKKVQGYYKKGPKTMGTSGDSPAGPKEIMVADTTIAYCNLWDICKLVL